MWGRKEKKSKLRTQRRRFSRFLGLILFSVGLVWALWERRSRQETEEPIQQPPESEPLEIPPVSLTQMEEMGVSEQPRPVEAEPSPDSLKRVEGIGPKVEKILNAAGIVTFDQLSNTPVERLNNLLQEAGLAFMKPDSWPRQAEFAAVGDWAGLTALQDALKGGR